MSRVVLALAAVLAVARTGAPFCGCRPVAVPHCADPAALHAVRVRIDFAVEHDAVSLITQTGPFDLPVSEIDGKQVLGIFLPRGEVFQGFLQEAVAGGILTGTMHGATADLSTGAIFAPGEYELLIFVDTAPGGPAGPQRGDIAAFDNTVCDPTGVSVRVAVGCEDASLTLTNRHFILF